MAETTRYAGKEYTWDQLVKKLGMDKARIEAPELDPKYQEMVKAEGQAKGSEDYSHKYIDPQTLTPGGMAGAWQAGTAALKDRGGLLPTALADFNEFVQQGGMPGKELGLILHGGNTGLGKALFGGPTGADPSKKGGGGGGGPAGPPKETEAQAEDAAINQMYQSVLSQFQGAANVVNPYISGDKMSSEAANATSLANAVSGGGVQGPNPAIQGVLSKDFQAQAAANQAGQQGIANAIQGMNQASQAAANVGPYSQLMNALVTKAQSNIVYQGAQPNVANAPAYVSEALAAANQFSPAAAAGANPVAAPVAPVTGSGSALPTAGGAGASSTGG